MPAYFYGIFDQTNPALVSIRDFFQKHVNVGYCEQYSMFS